MGKLHMQPRRELLSWWHNYFVSSIAMGDVIFQNSGLRVDKIPNKMKDNLDMQLSAW